MAWELFAEEATLPFNNNNNTIIFITYTIDIEPIEVHTHRKKVSTKRIPGEPNRKHINVYMNDRHRKTDRQLHCNYIGGENP